MKPDDITIKEMYTPTPSMNTGTKILYNYLAKSIHQYTGWMMPPERVGFTPGMQGWSKALKSISVTHRIDDKERKSGGHLNSCRRSTG